MNLNKDDKKWHFKLQLYNQDEHLAMKHYNNDAFCHEYCITGRCSSRTQNQCQLDHNIPIIFKDIATGNSDPEKLHFCRILTNYFCYIYISNNNNHDHDKTNGNYNIHSQKYTPFIKSCLGSFAAIDGNFALSRQYFDDAIEVATKQKKNGMLCSHDAGCIFFHYARVLSQHFKDWDKSEIMYKAAIVECPDCAIFHCKYAKELIYRDRFELARYHVDMANKYNPALLITKRVQRLLMHVTSSLSNKNSISHDQSHNSFSYNCVEKDSVGDVVASRSGSDSGNLSKVDVNFCHTFCTLGRCLYSGMNEDKTQLECKFDHSKQDTIKQMVSNKQFDKALNYCQYLLKYYQQDNCNAMDDVGKKHMYTILKSRLFGHLGDIYSFGCRNDSDIFQSIKHYEESNKLDPKDLNHKTVQQCHQLARLYDEKLNNWNKGEYYYLYCIEKKPQIAFFHYTYAMSLKNRQMFDKACKYFDNALSIQPNHARYLTEYSVSMYHLGPKYYAKCREIAKQGIQCCNMQDIKSKKRLEALILKIDREEHSKNYNKSFQTNACNSDCKSIMVQDDSIVIGTNINIVDVLNRAGLSCNYDKSDAKLFHVNNENKLLIEEFEKFWNNLAFVEPFKSKYHTFFVENKLNNILCLLFFVDDNYKCLLHEKLKMNKVHKKYFIKQIKLWIIKCQEFEMWLKYMPFDNDCDSDEYLHRFRIKGITTMESFCFHVKSLQNLKQIIDSDLDCKIVWNRLFC